MDSGLSGKVDGGINHSLGSLLISKNLSERARIGQVFFIANCSRYGIKHINGEAAGFWSICCDDTPGREKFTSLGLPYNGATLAGVGQKLLEEFNQKPIGLDFVTQKVATKILRTIPKPELADAKLLADYKISYDTFRELEGGRIIFRFDLNFERIAQLTESSLDQARALFDEWNKDLRPIKKCEFAPI